MNKRGLSTIVVVLIIVLLSLVAVGIVWAVIKNIISEKAEGISLGKLTLDAGIENVIIDNSSNNISLVVKRNPGYGEMSGMKFIFYNGTDSEIITEEIILKEFELKTFLFHLDKLDVDNLIKISIVPIFKSDSGKEIVGDVVDSYSVGGGGGGGSFGTLCVANCTGKVCGSDGCGGTCPPGCSGGYYCDAGTCIEGTNPCQLTNAYWSHESVTEGTLVSLSVTGTDCSGIDLNYSIYEDDLWPLPDNFVTSFVVTNLSSTWIAEWQEDIIGDPEYYFVVSVVGETEEITSSAPLLTVTQLPKTCLELGGIICTGEQYCPGEILNASDTDRCCSGSCEEPTCTTCDTCGDGFFNICDRQECYSCTSDTCYFLDKLINKCNSCTGATCVSYEDDQTTCNDDPCSLGNCEWGGSNCVQSGGAAEGLVAYYPFNGNANDESGNGNDGSVYGADCNVAGVVGQACSFDGVNDYVEISTNSWTANKGTITLWARANGFSDTQCFFAHTTLPAYANRIQLYTDDSLGNLDLGLGDQHYRATNIFDLNTTTWYHIALTWNGSNYIVYVNGNENSSGIYSGLSNINSFADIGNNGNNASRTQSFDGIIDEIRIYNRSLSSTEINDIYNDITIPPCIPFNCSGLGYECDDWNDGCGGTISCGPCAVNETCVSGSCVVINQTGIPLERLPPNGKWEDIKWTDPNPGGWTTLDVSTQGILPNGADMSSNLHNLIISVSDYTILYFPAGTYTFNDRVLITRSNIILRGAGPNQTIFDFVGGSGFVIWRSRGSEISITSDVPEGATTIPVSDASIFSVGNFVKIVEDNENFEAEWGRRARGGMFFLTAIDTVSDTITIDLPLPISLDNVVVRNATVQRIIGKHDVGFENFRIQRDSTASGSTFGFMGIYNSYIKNIESYMTTKHHLSCQFCRNVILSDSLFDDAYNHGTGGHGYGALFEYLSTNNLVTNNIFKDLRHEMVVQTGAVYNVYSYNFDSDWYQDLCFVTPSDPLCHESSSNLHAQDIYYEVDVAVHGHYANNNLWEGNKLYYAQVDYGHTENGPKNTFFRNHYKGQPPVLSWKPGVGMIIDGQNEKQNIIGNTFINDSYIQVGSWGSYPTPIDTFIGANDVIGTVTYQGSTESSLFNWDNMSGSTNIPNSLSLTQKPDFWPNDLEWPPFGPDVSNSNTNKIPAQLRYEAMIS